MENQIVEAINYIKKISKKKTLINRLLAHINNTTANNWDKEFVEDTLYKLRVKGVIDEHFKILLADNTIISASNETAPLLGHPLTSMSAKSASIQTHTTPVSPISSEKPADFIVNDTKDEQICNLNLEIKALKSFIVEQLYVIKKSIEDIKCQESIPNGSYLLQSLKEELSYLRNENLNKTSIIKSLTENHCVPVNINSAVFPPNLHHKKVQVEKHKSTTNKLYESPKTDCKSIINLHEIKSKGTQKINQDLRPNIPQKKKKNTYTW